MRTQHTLAVILIAVAGCGGVTSQDGEGDDALTRPIGNPCHVANPGYISLDGVDAGPRRTVAGTNYEVIGEPMYFLIRATAHQPYPGSGLDHFTHTVVVDGVGFNEELTYAWYGTLDQTTIPWWGATVEASTPGIHTVSLSSACGTETRSFITNNIAATAPTPSLSVDLPSVALGSAVTLKGGTGLAYSTCAESRAHLVGKQDDGKVVLDETYPPEARLSWSRTVQPLASTSYTLTMSCALATYAPPQTVSVHVQVTAGGSTCTAAQATTYPFCQSCPSNVSFYPPWTTTLLETACKYDDAWNAAHNMGTNCALSDGPCP